MNFEDRFTNLELSIKLKELGIPQKSLFYWEYLNEKSYGLRFVMHTIVPRDSGVFQHFSAFSSDELMDLLPCFVDTKKKAPFNNFWLQVHKRRVKNIQYSVKYICDSHSIDRYGNMATVKFGDRNIYDESLSNALAKMLIYLLEENLYVKIEPIDIEE